MKGGLQKIVVLCAIALLLGLVAYTSMHTVQDPAVTEITDGVVEMDRSYVDRDVVDTSGPEDLPVIKDGKVIDSFKDCAAAGYPVMESYPAKCRANGVLFIEKIKSATSTPTPTPEQKGIVCTPEQKKAEACTMEYAPVCGLVEVQCVTTPCNPVPETFGNACGACAQGNVASYTEGACEV